MYSIKVIFAYLFYRRFNQDFVYRSFGATHKVIVDSQNVLFGSGVKRGFTTKKLHSFQSPMSVERMELFFLELFFFVLFFFFFFL